MNRLASMIAVAGMSAFLVVLGACSGKAHRIEPIAVTVSPGDNPNEKIASLEKEFAEARADGVPLLAPTWYQQAFSSLNEAKQMRDSKDDLESVFRKSAEAEFEITRAKQVSIESRKITQDVLDARQHAILALDSARQAGAVDLAEVREEFEKADRSLVDLTAAVEYNDLNMVRSKKPEVIQTFKKSERLALSKENLDKARRTIAEAKDQGARSYAPQSFEIAQSTFDRAQKMIMEEPISRDEAARLGKEADQYAERALRMTYEARNVSGRRPEQVALGVDKQMSTKANQISELSREADRGRGALATEKSVATVREMFEREEADVFRDGNRIIVRMKTMKFPVGKAEISERDAQLMEKLKMAVASLPAGQVTVEGHTDSTGDTAFNEQLSQKRAENVKDYLISEGVESARVQAVGKGATEPIMANNSKAGRATNRRIDLIVEIPATQRTAE